MTLIYSLNVKSIKERLTCSFIIIFSPVIHGGVVFTSPDPYFAEKYNNLERLNMVTFKYIVTILTN